MNGQRVRSHEEAGFLALGFLCWLVKELTGNRSLGVYAAPRSEDLGKGTDIGLVYQGKDWRRLGLRRRVLFVDVTTGNRRTIADKIRRSKEMAQQGGRYVEIIPMPQGGPVMDVEIVPGSDFLDAYQRLRSTRATRFSPWEVSPKGTASGLVKALAKLGKEMIISGLGHKPNWQRLFQIAGVWVWDVDSKYKALFR